MSHDSNSLRSGSPDYRARLTRRLERSDPFLIRMIQGAALIGCIVGILIYSWQAVRDDTAHSRRALSDAASVGQVAAEAEIARIEAVAVQTSPLILAALRPEALPESQLALRAEISRKLEATPVTAIVVFNPSGGTEAVFGQLPPDASRLVSPASSSQRAGSELLALELVQVSNGRAAYYRDLRDEKGGLVKAAFVLRANAFQPALQVGAAAGGGWRAAILNRDGETVLTAAAGSRAFTELDARMAASALGWPALHTDESTASDQVAGEVGEAFLETRAVAGNLIQLAYVGEAAPAYSILASRRFEFIALLGASLLAVALAISVIQNEWQRHDRNVRDADLMAARADVTCDLLAAGVIDWSVADGRVVYSEGWADLFSQGNEPVSEEIFDWVARIHPDDRASASRSYQAMLDGRETELVHRMRVRMSSGLWVQVVERGRAIAGIDGRAKRIVLVQTTEAVDGSALRDAFGAVALPAAQAV